MHGYPPRSEIPPDNATDNASGAGLDIWQLPAQCSDSISLTHQYHNNETSAAKTSITYIKLVLQHSNEIPWQLPIH